MDLAGLGPAVADALREHHVPGVSVATFDADGITCESWGVAAPGRPVTERTIFEAASMAKPVTAYVVLTLVADGVLDLDVPLCRYVDQRYVDDPRIEVVTARHALTHRSGLWVETNDAPPYFEKDPALEFMYSNVGFTCVQQAVEQITGETFDVVAGRLLRALEMDDSSFVWRPDYEQYTAVPHDDDGAVLGEKWRPDVAWSPGSLHTTAVDYARFFRAILTREGPALGPLVDEMLRPHVDVREDWGGGPPDPGSSWGLGIGLQTGEPTSFWHWGWNDGFLSFAVAWPDDGRGVVALTNGTNGLWVCKAIVTAISGRVHPAFRWLGH
jgi:CubicO group peptidase (beta-lactamase class C family)